MFIKPVFKERLNTEYYVQIALGVFKDAATNNYAGISDTTTWSFTTEANQTNTWSGATDTNWATVTNWSLGRAPISTDNVVIADVANDPIINSGTHATVNDFTVNASGVFVINGGGDLTINGNQVNNGTCTLNSASSLIVNGTSTGNITYKRNLGTANWYLTSSPFIGQSINTFVTDVVNAIATNGTNYAVAPYDNNGKAWNYYTTGAGTNNVAAAGVFVSGKGYFKDKW